MKKQNNFFEKAEVYFNKMGEEAKLQRLCVSYLQIQKPNWLIYHIKNAEPNAFLRIVYSWLGVVSGMPDLHIITPQCDFFVELKTQKGKTSVFQKATHQKLQSLNKQVYTINSFEDFLNLIKEKSL